MGMDYYPQALSYYEKAGYNEGIYLIGDLYAAKPENIEQGAATYIMLKEREGYKKAGDLYYNRGDLVKAMEYYATGGVIEGYQKFATELKKADKMKEYIQVVEIITDTLRKRNDMDAISEYAVQAERDNNYTLASSLYAKLGNTKLEKQYAAYNHMMGLEVILAKDIFNSNGNEDIAEDIDRNIKALTDMQQSLFVLKELEKSVPKVASKVNTNTGILEYDKNDLKLRSQHYANPATQKSIADVVYGVGANYAKLKCQNAKLQGLTREAMLKFRPVKNILDNYDFTKKIIPINITPAAVTF
jgi:tetratricopeptide (TPR) repeat protein